MRWLVRAIVVGLFGAALAVGRTSAPADSQDMGTIEDRLAQLEARVATIPALEARIAALEARPIPTTSMSMEIPQARAQTVITIGAGYNTEGASVPFSTTSPMVRVCAMLLIPRLDALSGSLRSTGGVITTPRGSASIGFYSGLQGSGGLVGSHGFPVEGCTDVGVGTGVQSVKGIGVDSAWVLTVIAPP